MSSDRSAAAALPYYPALDGIRGVSVGAVLLFHAGFSWAGGGYLGVSTFFTLSGFLITSLLLREHAASGEIRLGAFWARRFRRLMPAAILALAGIVVYGHFLASPSQLSRLRFDVLSSLFYVSNWWFMDTGHSYFEIFTRPSPAQHFWSLSIEEQFYALFPLIAVLVLPRGRRTFFWLLAAVAAVSALAGPILTGLGASSARIYYGTDTRIFEILFGCLLAVLWWSAPRPGGASDRLRRAAPLLGAVGFAVVCADIGLVRRDSEALYRGLLVLHAAASTALIAGALVAGPVSRGLSLAPLAWLGRISYGVYLYHWPIFLWLDHQRTGLGEPALFGLRVALTLFVAQLSYSLIEMPIRRGRLLAAARTWIAAPLAAAAVGAGAVWVTVDPPVPWHATAGPWRLRPMPERQPDAPAGPVRIMMIGDSVGWNVGQGLVGWAKELPEVASTWNMATYGCGIARRGARPGVPRLPKQLAECDSWADWWEVQVERFRPDVVVVHSGSWDIIDRRLPEWDDVRRPGDPVFDAWLVGEYQEAVDLLSSRGAHVVWLSLPCYDVPPVDQPMRGTGAFDAKRHAHLRNEIIPRLAESRPDRLSVYDLFAKVCPDGRFVTDLPGVGRLRPDYAHLSGHGSVWVARELGPFAIRQAGFGLTEEAGPLRFEDHDGGE